MLTSFEHPRFAVRRVDRTIARSIASTAIFIVFLQAIPHAFSQASILNPVWFWLGVSAIAAIQLAQVVVAWLGHNIGLLYFAMYLAILVLIAGWPLALVHPMAAGDMPWLWWLLAIGGMNAFAAFKPVPAIIAAVTLSAVWLALSQTDAYGPRNFGVALQDTLLAFFFSALLGMLLIALRQETAKIDAQLDRKAALAAESASTRAIETERSRMNALVHDSVLTALLLGANANRDDDLAAAARAASGALDRLTRDSRESTGAEVSASALFESLGHAALQIAGDLHIVADDVAQFSLPAAAAEALAEATFQAINNSVRHAGTVRHRELRLSSTASRVKIIIKDDGRGFRESRVSKSRLGVRLSIRERVTEAGGRVAIQAAPGHGTTIALVWPARGDAGEGSNA
ncbi:MAG: hypothetical protein RL605_570 [Actinomycetota bacterium]